MFNGAETEAEWQTKQALVMMQNPDTGVPNALAFLFPHQRSAHGSIEDFLVTMDVVEAMSGVDFFSKMEDETEKWVEGQPGLPD